MASTQANENTNTAASSPASLIHLIRSAVDRVEVAGLFPNSQPLELELGSGDGSFLAEYARRHPEHNFIGVERLLGRLKKLDRKGRRFGLTNLCCLRIESAYFLQYLLPSHCVTALHIYFPDPWPKRKHRQNRIVNERFPLLAREILVPGGIVYLRTDDEDYFEQMLAVFSAAPFFTAIETPEELSGLVTDFEKGFNAQGIATRHAAYRLSAA